MISRFFSTFPKVADALADEACKVIDAQAEKTYSELEKMLLVEQSQVFAKTGLYEKILDEIET
jgi:hypothetical protein